MLFLKECSPVLIYRNGFFLIYLLIFGALGPHCSAPAPSSCSDWAARAAHRGGFSHCGAGLRTPGSGRPCTWAQQWHLGLGAPQWGCGILQPETEPTATAPAGSREVPEMDFLFFFLDFSFKNF